MSSRVISASENLTARQILGFTSRANAVPMKELNAGTIIPYAGHILQEITNENTGEVFESLLIISEPDDAGEKKLFATRSDSVKKALTEIITTLKEMGDNDPFSVKVEKLKSKAGREFITVSLSE